MQLPAKRSLTGVRVWVQVFFLVKPIMPYIIARFSKYPITRHCLHLALATEEGNARPSCAILRYENSHQ